jgi:hypothetical protein
LRSFLVNLYEAAKNLKADDCPAARCWIGVFVIAQFAAIIADRRPQPHNLSTQAVGARTYLHFCRPSLGIPEANRTGRQCDALETGE